MKELDHLIVALWQSQSLRTRGVVRGEIGALIAQTAARNVRVDVGTPVHLQWDVARKGVEELVRQVVTAFASQSDAVELPTAYLRGDAPALFQRLAQAELRAISLGFPSMFAEGSSDIQARIDRNVESLIGAELELLLARRRVRDLVAQSKGEGPVSKTIINVTGSAGVNVNTGYVGGDQLAAALPPRALEILGQMRVGIEADTSLNRDQREIGLRKLVEVERELAAPAPSAGSVRNSLADLGNLASIGSFATELTKVLGPWLLGLG